MVGAPLDQEIIFQLFDFNLLIVLHVNKRDETPDLVPASVIKDGHHNLSETDGASAEQRQDMVAIFVYIENISVIKMKILWCFCFNKTLLIEPLSRFEKKLMPFFQKVHTGWILSGSSPT